MIFLTFNLLYVLFVLYFATIMSVYLKDITLQIILHYVVPLIYCWQFPWKLNYSFILTWEHFRSVPLYYIILSCCQSLLCHCQNTPSDVHMLRKKYYHIPRKCIMNAAMSAYTDPEIWVMSSGNFGAIVQCFQCYPDTNMRRVNVSRQRDNTNVFVFM